MNMTRQQAQVGFGLLALIAICVAVTANPAVSVTPGGTDSEDHRNKDVPLTPDQIRALVGRVIENQRRNDAALEQYARTEKDTVRHAKDEGQSETVSRVIPIRGGFARVEFERDGKPLDPRYVAEQWGRVAQALNGQNSSGHWKDVQDRYSKRKRERAEMVNAIGQAFLFHWAGRTVEGGRPLVQLSFEPNPAFKSSARFANVYAHTRGTVWVDENSEELVRAIAVLSDDVYWAGGLIAKLYKGGQFSYQQEQVAPGVWVPSLYAYDFDGRKLVFSSLSLHQRTAYVDYRHVGSPSEALAIIRHEHPEVESDP